MFFARTQKEHVWKSPRYQFKRRQREAWEALVRLKIHYNTTARGHVEWIGQDELLYGDLHFSMAQFRGMVHGLASESRRLLTKIYNHDHRGLSGAYSQSLLSQHRALA
jgi:hypothetical protein